MSLGSLSTKDIEHLHVELAAGRPTMVWFTSEAVGMQAGRSAKIVGFTDPAEGDFIQIRPTGTQDVLSFSPAELTLNKPERKRNAVASPATFRLPVEQPIMSENESVPTLSVVSPETASAPAEAATQPAKKPRQPSAAKKTRVADVVVTISGSVDGDWTVDVVAAKKKALRAIPVTPAVVGQAAKALHPDVAETIESVLESAREQHRLKVEQLRAELEAAQKALDELAG